MQSDLPLPFTREDVFRGVHKAFALPANELRERDKPRASSLMGDAREIAYMMAGTVPIVPLSDRIERLDSQYTAEQGRMTEDITCAAIEAGTGGLVRVTSRQVELPEDYWATGHPDGELEFFNTEVGQYQQRDENGLLWGFEHKHFGRFTYKQCMSDGAEGEVLCQALVYGYARGWDAVLICLTSQDASSIRMEMKRAKKGTVWGDFVHSKMMLFAIDLRELYPLIPQISKRAQWFIDWKARDGNPANVAVEAATVSPDTFPWGWSDYVVNAEQDGEGGEKAPVPPFPRDWAK